MKRTILERAKKMAREAGYHDAVQTFKKYKGFEMVEPIFTDGEEHIIGLPEYILVRDQEIRWTTHEEIMDMFGADDEEEEAEE